ncbi:MAG TPA: hypothetical protein VL308_02795 [Gemmatimonadaceae bacterium]|nr:hypothetical protein [Gemmatimonadaceae bacterium]
MRTSSVILAIAVLGAAAGTAAAQGRSHGRNNDNVPPGHRPPAGMCRIWIDGVPPGHQPAPTDCQTAVRNQPPNSRIIWGDNTNRRDQNVYDNRNDRNDRRDHQRDYPRDANGHPYDPTCVDNNRDGWCDYHPEMPSGVRTRDDTHHGNYPDSHGRYPGNNGGYPGNNGGYPGNNGGYPGTTGGTINRGQYPSQMPAMTGASLIRVGVRTVDVQNWLGRGSLRAETTDANGDGVPEVATWYDGSGNIVQVWHDENRDGRADYVEIYRNGQRVGVIR